MVVIGVENDIGFALLIFTLFIALLWITTGRVGYLVLGLVLFAVGAVVAAHLFAQVHERVAIWLDPWRPPTTTGASWSRAGTPGHRRRRRAPGSGSGQAGICDPLHHQRHDLRRHRRGDGPPRHRAWWCSAFLLLVGAGLRIAQTARSDFSKLVATGLTIISASRPSSSWPACCGCCPSPGITLPFWPTGVVAGGQLRPDRPAHADLRGGVATRSTSGARPARSPGRARLRGGR